MSAKEADSIQSRDLYPYSTSNRLSDRSQVHVIAPAQQRRGFLITKNVAGRTEEDERGVWEGEVQNVTGGRV